MIPAFFDTNILVYADDDRSPEKQAAANDLLREYGRENAAAMSTQVLQEYFVTATRRLGLSAEFARRKIEIHRSSRVVLITDEHIVAAIELHRLHTLSFWDSLIIQAAHVGGVEILFTEDMQHGRRIAGLEIRNPFLGINE